MHHGLNYVKISSPMQLSRTSHNPQRLSWPVFKIDTKRLFFYLFSRPKGIFLLFACVCLFWPIFETQRAFWAVFRKQRAFYSCLRNKRLFWPVFFYLFLRNKQPFFTKAFKKQNLCVTLNSSNLINDLCRVLKW